MTEKIYNYKELQVTSITVGDNNQQKKVNELLKKFNELFPDAKATSFNGVISYITEHYTDFGYDTKKALNSYLNEVSKDKDIVDNVMSLIDNYNSGDEETTSEPTANPELITEPEQSQNGGPQTPQTPKPQIDEGTQAPKPSTDYTINKDDHTLNNDENTSGNTDGGN